MKRALGMGHGDLESLSGFSSSGGKEIPAPLRTESPKILPESSRCITRNVSGSLRLDCVNDSRTVRSSLPKTLERVAQDSESRWSSEQSWVNVFGLTRVVTKTFAHSGGLPGP